jgi:hypothetical protein
VFCISPTALEELGFRVPQRGGRRLFDIVAPAGGRPGLLDSRRIDLGLYDSLLRGALLDRDPDGWETNSWANRKVLDSAAAWFRMNESDALDLTFLIYQKDSGYPSVIDGQDSTKPTEHQKSRAREEAQKIIDKYRPGSNNPY